MEHFPFGGSHGIENWFATDKCSDNHHSPLFRNPEARAGHIDHFFRYFGDVDVRSFVDGFTERSHQFVISFIGELKYTTMMLHCVVKGLRG